MYYIQVADARIEDGWTSAGSSERAGPENGFIRFDDALDNGEKLAREVWEGHPSWRIWLDDGTAEGKVMYRNPGFPDDWWREHDNIVTLVRYMASDSSHFNKHQIASAVEKPWKYADAYAEALAELANES